MQDSFTQSYPPPPQSAIKDRAPNNAPSNGEIELPTHITSNLKKELRDYQKQAIYNYLEKRQSHPTQKHFMFEMATGSGKTLVMAGLILECCKQGYQNFIFFVNSTSILEKTKLNFTDSVSSKYLFSENITINDENTENKGDKTYYIPHTLNKIPINYFLKALNLKNLDFKTLKKAFKKHAFNNKVEFIECYISPLKTNFHKNQKFDDNKTLLKIAVYIIENLKDTLLKEQDKYDVSALELKEFETHNRSLSASELEKDIPLYEWLLFKDMRKLDSDLEREFLDFINDHKEVLDKKFKEWCILRNDHFTELKVFCNIENSPYYAQGFEPDFILFAQTHSDEFLGFTCYMEAKGEHLEYSNAWKEEFLKMLENATLKSHNKKLDLKGLPFFTLKNSVVNSEFTTAFNQIFKDQEC